MAAAMAGCGVPAAAVQPRWRATRTTRMRCRCCEDTLGVPRPRRRAPSAGDESQQPNQLYFPVLRPSSPSPPPRPRRIVLVRHGQSEGNVDESAYTRVPDPLIGLTPKGRRQAEDSGRRLHRLFSSSPSSGSESDDESSEENWKVYFYVSPYRRTLETLRGLGRAFSAPRIAGVREEPRLREQDFGNFQDREKMRVEKEARRRYGRFFYRFPDGESAADVYDRITGFRETLRADIDIGRFQPPTPSPATAPEMNLVLVSHGLTLRVFHAVVQVDGEPVRGARQPRQWRRGGDADRGGGEVQLAGASLRRGAPGDGADGGDDRGPGASEENIRILFQKAYRTAPSIVFIDEIDAIASKRENLQREMERRIVTQLMTCMDEFHQNVRSDGSDLDSQSSEKKPGYVIVIGATNRPDAVDQALRRPGRFDREISLGVPDETARQQILKMLAKNLTLEAEGQFDLFKIARATPGFVGADLKALVDKAGNLAMKRIIIARKKLLGDDENNEQDWWRLPWNESEMENLCIAMDDFENAVTMVQPSLRREGFSSVPDVTWEDVGGLDSLRKEFYRCIVRCIKYPEDYKEYGVNMQAGFLLFGPPGCGKTLIAKAVGHDAGASFIHIKGPELLNKYVGESESEVRKIFTRARTNSPCILFFDEIDALTTKRGKEGGWVVERLLNQLLIELDGADQRHGVYVIGATNRIDVIDEAVLRPGRFGKKHFVPLPGADERVSILKAHAKNKPVSADVDLDTLARRQECNNLSGADLASLVNEAAMAALGEKIEFLENGTASRSLSFTREIELVHFEHALSKVKPSVSEQQRKHFDMLSKKYSAD